MAQFPFVPISKLTRWNANGKTIRGRVITKSAKRTYDVEGGEDDMFCFMFSDGTAEIEMVAFGNQVDQHFDNIALNEYYSISDFTTTVSELSLYSLTSFDFALTLTERTQIYVQIPKINYNICMISNLRNFRNNDPVNVMGVCDHVEELDVKYTKSTGREVDFRKIYLIDSSGTSVGVPLWAYEARDFDLEIGDIVYLYGARKSTWRGEIQLRTVMNTMMLCEDRDLPEDIPGLETLRHWWQWWQSQQCYYN